MTDLRKQSLVRLLEAAQEKGCAGPAAVAKALNASDQQINNWKSRGVPHAMAIRAQEKWGVSAQWIATGDGERWVAGHQSVPGRIANSPQVDGSDLVIAQYDTGGAMGHGFALEDNPPGLIKSWRVDKEWLRLNVPVYSSAENLCIVTGFGPSMKPRYNPGDPLLCDLGVQEVEVDGIYFFRIDGHGFIKQLQRIPTESGMILRAKSFNPDYDSFDISQKMEFQVFGKILMAWRSEQF
ncbi:MAG: helix-turn-helix transcriptional regulator [Alcaligenaceae bacterium]|nr:MAG: helix-turn-helix transcriptional regulator [Alcaligenaceae bacterium]